MQKCYRCGTVFEPEPEREKAWAESDRDFDPTDWECPDCVESDDVIPVVTCHMCQREYAADSGEVIQIGQEAWRCQDCDRSPYPNDWCDDDEEDDYYSYTCEVCGGEVAEDYSSCTCDDEEDDNE